MHFSTHSLTVFLLMQSMALASRKRDSNSTCHFVQSPNATDTNYPGADPNAATTYPYNVTASLSVVPIATVCNSPPSNLNSTAELACARAYINAIDDQLACLYARRLGYAAVAGHAKLRNGTELNDPSRNDEVAQAMALRVAKYGGSAQVGAIMGGETCQIYGSLVYEVQNIQQICDAEFDPPIPRPCNDCNAA